MLEWNRWACCDEDGTPDADRIHPIQRIICQIVYACVTIVRDYRIRICYNTPMKESGFEAGFLLRHCVMVFLGEGGST